MKTHKSVTFCLQIALLTTTLLASHQLLAATIELTAKFNPDPGKPYENQFVNTTPNYAYCAERPHICAANKTFSVELPFRLNANASIQANHSNPRHGAMFKVPGEWRNVIATSKNGDTKVLKLRVTGFGGQYRTNVPVTEITGKSSEDYIAAHMDLWSGSSWAYPPHPCSNAGTVGMGYFTTTFFWLMPNSPTCAKRALYTLEDLGFQGTSMAYELITPNPLEMESGTYTGSVNYTLGPHQDFDFGDVMIPTDSILTINFTLEVQHLIKVQFPPGSERLTLNPDGGWQQWLHRGRRPEKLSANQAFQFSSSSPVSMHIQCQYTVGDQCGIQNNAGHLVSVETRVTLPPGLVDKANKPVNRHLLSKNNSADFHPTYYVDNGRAALHFEVGQESVQQMIDHAGSRYSGNVTVVWDAKIQ